MDRLGTIVSAMLGVVPAELHDDLVDLETAADCCGAAGSYALLRPTDARPVLEPKLAELAQRDIGILVVNPDCYRYLASQLKRERSRIEVIHLAELMTQATSA